METKKAAEKKRTCRVCGCSESDACFHLEQGNCWWVEKDLCSHCAYWPGEAQRYGEILEGNSSKTSSKIVAK